MNIKQTRFYLIAFGYICLLLLNTVYAEKPSEADALNGINEGKVIWSITIGKPTKLLLFLRVIEETYDDLERQNVKPDMVFLFHGHAMKLISTKPIDLPLDEEEAHEEILKLIRRLSHQPGIKMESCSISARLLNINNESIIPDIKPVGNTFVSQIGYQKKGYAMIPIH